MTLYDITYIIYDIIYDTVLHPTMQVLFVSEAIRKAQHGSPLHGLAPVDTSDEIIEVLLAALLWDMQQRRFGLTAEGLEKLHALSVELLDLIKENMPDRTGGVKGWNFEKAHSILHKVRDILLLGWSENFSHLDLSTAILAIASVWLIAQTTKRCISLYFGHWHIPVKATCGICSPWKQICPPLHKTRVMVVRNPSLWLVLVLTRKVKLVLVSWVSGTQHCRP